MKIKILGIFLIFLSLLYADDNPFKMDENISLAILPQFQKEEVKFNSSARILKSITFNYINLDGSEGRVDLDINKSIDWHDTYIVSRFKSPDPSRVLDVSVTIPENGSKQESNITANVEIPLEVSKIYDFISYAVYKNKIKLITTDEMITDLSVGNPNKIVIDFRSRFVSPTKNIRLSNSIFKRIDFGSHKGYYRLVIYLDGTYYYHIQKDATGYMISLF
ncbi:AMIN domain-containing protein [Campylobacter hepaticus]|uniref:AMIN domain-containing protein n=1 Tax=Campylobacter hepaticus TaxID=1813019 RepID=A0A6A7JUB4_9BACT|nr:AMIN domain-containing protein [Campylobacter hepaticus]AXP09273.1 AMIN domain-containing protein [Campylobacter hepaticus]MCZ0773004.1 AMIN domain-containing protein [Campylobacter hepaticus]MCZ0774457.1 AMIN domain-containing protein [Campylobacter hepaticus]MCZ0774480.1 AMIN domain-containing protein [Campylobacter hepaticus]MCZ0775709.1 AMIN domain-containing protein [Campylobacter hepaticus]